MKDFGARIVFVALVVTALTIVYQLFQHDWHVQATESQGPFEGVPVTFQRISWTTATNGEVIYQAKFILCYETDIQYLGARPDGIKLINLPPGTLPSVDPFDVSNPLLPNWWGSSAEFQTNNPTLLIVSPITARWGSLENNQFAEKLPLVYQADIDCQEQRDGISGPFITVIQVTISWTGTLVNPTEPPQEMEGVIYRVAQP